MNIVIAIIVLIAATLLLVPAFAAFSSWRHPFLSILTIALTLLASLGAYYAYAESQSLPWTIGYGLLALLGAAASYRHLTAPATGAGTKFTPENG
jgi:nicotinamide riboside transporter PnuC